MRFWSEVGTLEISSSFCLHLRKVCGGDQDESYPIVSLIIDLDGDV